MRTMMVGVVLTRTGGDKDGPRAGADGALTLSTKVAFGKGGVIAEHQEFDHLNIPKPDAARCTSMFWRHHGRVKQVRFSLGEIQRGLISFYNCLQDGIQVRRTVAPCDAQASRCTLQLNLKLPTP